MMLRAEGWQKLAKDCPPEYLMRVRGEPRPPRPHVDESDWPPNLNGTPEHPWKLTLYLYLLDVDTGEISTFWTNTVGGKVAIGQLADQVAFMRQARPDALPVVALESRDMPTQFGGTNPRPHFRILGYKSRGNVGAQNLLSGSEQKVALPDVEAPSIAEQLNDDLARQLEIAEASAVRIQGATRIKQVGPRSHAGAVQLTAFAYSEGLKESAT
jgi:hypothetical protein